MELPEGEIRKCRCGKMVSFQAITATLDEGFCSEECLVKAMKEGKVEETKDQQAITEQDSK